MASYDVVRLTASVQVSYEYIACQQERQGVMILSEFAGAAQSLNGSIVVNPWDSQQVADAIFEAVTMDADTRAENHRKLFKVRFQASSTVPVVVNLTYSVVYAVREQVLGGVLGHLVRPRDDPDRAPEQRPEAGRGVAVGLDTGYARPEEQHPAASYC